jgi:CRISPR-associated RAMP protein (TIGR02581 family)
MLKKLLNQATLELTIEAQGPLLIKSSIEGGADPSVPDMQFVRSGGQVYIPGSSLKGVFRSYTEKIARTVGARCCNPFDTDDKSPDCFCGKRLENRRESTTVYRQSCHICRLFGSTALASRIKFNDAYPLNGEIPNTETRTSIAIDRILGSVAQGPFDFEVVTTATFKTSIHLRNFELWQMGLVALVLRDLGEGLIPIGFGKSRGLGEVEAKVTSFSVRYIGAASDMHTNARHALYGIGSLATAEERGVYGLSGNDAISLDATGNLGDDDLGVRVTLNGAAQQEAFRKCVNERWCEVARHDRSR